MALLSAVAPVARRTASCASERGAAPSVGVQRRKPASMGVIDANWSRSLPRVLLARSHCEYADARTPSIILRVSDAGMFHGWNLSLSPSTEEFLRRLNA